MREVVKKTGDFGIGQMIHSVHMTDDVPELNKFYEEVFGGVLYLGVDEPNFLPIEDRWAGLILIGELCIETMAPNVPVDATKPVGKFYSKFGKHLHSIGYKVDDLDGLGDHLIAEGVYIGKPGGGKVEHMSELAGLGYFYPSPRDTNGLMIECCAMDMPNDPRNLETWSSQVKIWEQGHPLTIHRLQYITLGVKDVTEALAVYTKRMQAVLVDEGIDDAEKAKYAIVQLGNCLLRIAEPLDSESELGKHVEKWGSTIYSITLGVRDLDSAEAWLNKKGVRTERISPQRLAANPEDCHGAPFFFSTETIPNDPFA